MQTVPLQKIQSPLSGLNQHAAFVDEIARDQHRNVALDFVIGGALGYLAVKAAQNRRARR